MPPRSRHAHGRSEIWERAIVVRAVDRELRRLARRLRELRKERKLTQEKAAERIGIHEKYLQRTELAKVNPAVATLVAIAVAYEVPLRALFSDDG